MSRQFAARLPAALLAALLPLAALAQDSAPAAAPAAVVAPEVSLEDAYKREFALLAAQKRELAQRIAEAKRAFEQSRHGLEAEVATLEGRALAAQAEAESMADAVAHASEREQTNADNAELVAATLEQAAATLGSFGVDALAEAGNAPETARLAIAFERALAQLQQLDSVRSAPGAFFVADGSEVQGTIVRYGNIAAFGVADQVAGALAPAGGGRFRLWNAPASAATARALAAGQRPDRLDLFVFENADTAVPEPQVKTVWGEAAKGGLIGYVILLLGALALVLIALRAVFLERAGAAITPILDAVQPAMRQGTEQAIAAAKRFKGSAARVVTAALRNLDHDREHLEDIVSESILHESTRLSRFGAVITTVAAVAPLLGLLGTVTGMIQTFDVITEFGTSDPKLLSGGIATALVTTELGLIVAIPCLLGGALLNGWAERIKDDMEKAALRVVTLYHGQRVLRVSAARPVEATA